MIAPVTSAELPPEARIATTAPTNDADVPRYDGILLATTSRNRIVQTPDIMIARLAFKPMINGKTNVAPNIATTCCAPTPIVLGQDNRSSGRTTSPSDRGLPSPTSFHPIAIFSSSRGCSPVGVRHVMPGDAVARSTHGYVRLTISTWTLTPRFLTAPGCSTAQRSPPPRAGCA